MTVLPIIEREVRVRARSRATYWTRFAVALVGTLLCVQQLIVSGFVGMGETVGRHVFNGMVAFAFLLCCAACLLAAEAISAERREGTLGLLFLTRVRDWDVVAGKLVSLGAASLFPLVGLLPAIVIPILAGGVSGGEACRKGAGLMATLLFALAAGLCGAAAAAQRLRAACGAVLIVILAALGPFICFHCATGGFWHYAGLCSPLVLMMAAGATDYQAAPGFYWGSLATVQALGWLLLMSASLLLRRSVEREGGTEVVRPPPPPAKLAREVGLGRWRPAREDAGPIEWLAYRQHGVSVVIWVTAVAALAFSRWVSLAGKPSGGAGAPSFWLLVWPLGLAAAAVGGGAVAWVASRFFASVRRTGELELLLPTPVGAETIVSDQWRVLKRIFTWPVLGLQVGTAVPVLGITGWSSSGLSAEMPLESTLAALLSFVNTFLGTSALCGLGLWFGLTARRQITAIFCAVGLAQGVPWLASLIVVMLGAAAAGTVSRPLPAANVVVSLLAEAGVLLFNLGLLWVARRGLAVRLGGAEPMRFNFCRPLWVAGRQVAVALPKLRHWTPS
jgi:ABC-2 family transporter protein